MWPIATKAPPTSSSSVSPVSALRSRTARSLPSSPATNSSGDERGLEVDVVLLAGPVEHDLRGPVLVAPVDAGELVGVLGDEDRVLHRRVAAADHGDVLALEEGAVADAAGGDAAAGELGLARDPEPARLGAHREDDRLGDVLVVADEDALVPAVGELDAVGVVGDEAGAEALGLGAELVHHLRPHDPLGIAGVVLDVGRVLKLPAPLEALDHERLEVGARGVERGRVAGGPAAEDDQVLDSLLAHISQSRSALSMLLHFMK